MKRRRRLPNNNVWYHYGYGRHQLDHDLHDIQTEFYDLPDNQTEFYNMVNMWLPLKNNELYLFSELLKALFLVSTFLDS